MTGVRRATQKVGGQISKSITCAGVPRHFEHIANSGCIWEQAAQRRPRVQCANGGAAAKWKRRASATALAAPAAHCARNTSSPATSHLSVSSTAGGAHTATAGSRRRWLSTSGRTCQRPELAERAFP